MSEKLFNHAQELNDLPGEERSSNNDEVLRKMGKVVELLEKNEVDIDATGELKEVRVAEWEVVTKNREVDDETGEVVHKPEVHQLSGVSLKFKPAESSARVDPDMFVRQAKPTIIKSKAVNPKRFKDKTDVILTDKHIGYLRQDENLIPIHDEKAIDVAHQVVRHIQPDRIVLLGDNMDFAQIGKFGDTEFTRTAQASIDCFHEELAQYRADAPDAKIVVLEGNHDERWMKYIRHNAAELIGIKRAKAAKELGVLTLPYLLRVEDLEVDYYQGYPANKYWINERLKAIHGNKVKSNGSTAAHIVKHDTSSTLFGHVHRIESHFRTVEESKGPRKISAHTFGTLARLDGTVPGYHSAYSQDGKPVTNFENWQQGMGVVYYKEGDNTYKVDTIEIDTFDGYEAIFDGKVFLPKIPKRKSNKKSKQ
jgi:predicted MPP superfamily phosphohydrolase